MWWKVHQAWRRCCAISIVNYFSDTQCGERGSNVRRSTSTLIFASAGMGAAHCCTSWPSLPDPFGIRKSLRSQTASRPLPPPDTMAAYSEPIDSLPISHLHLQASICLHFGSSQLYCPCRPGFLISLVHLLLATELHVRHLLPICTFPNQNSVFMITTGSWRDFSSHPLQFFSPKEKAQ